MKNFILKIWKVLVSEFSPLILMVVSPCVFLWLIIPGLIYMIFKSLIETFQWKFWKGPIYFVLFWLRCIYEIWNSIKELFMNLAIFPDKLCNATSGEMLEDLITPVEKTLFGKGKKSISTAIGHLEVNHLPILNFGKKLSKTLSVVLDKNHCTVSYKRDEHNQKFEL